MKKILFTLFAAILLMAIPNEAKASHAAGGEITYEYVGPNPNGPGHVYCVYMTIYRDDSGTTLPTSTSISINSSCYASQTVTVTRQSVTPPQDYTSCVDANASQNDIPPISQNYYSNCNVILPGNCVDWKFSWSICCRNDDIDNLVNPESYNLYLEANLNNTLGQNTSGSFINPAAKSFCVGRPFTWSQAAIEPDGDSIAFELGQPLTAANTPINYNTGWSITDPMKTTSGITIDPLTGTFYFTPSSVETDVIKILFREYRYHSTFGWIEIGSVFRELQIPIVQQCNLVAQQGITIDSTTSAGGVTAGTTTMNTDSLREVYGVSAIGNDSTAAPGGGYQITMPGVPYNCYDSIINLGFSTKLKCSSFSSNGSEFRIIGPDGISRPVIGVDTKCGTDLLTDNVNLFLHKPLDTNGNYLLYLKTGDDGDVLENECGFGVKAFFSIIIEVRNCPILDYKMLNTTVENDQDIRIDWDVNDTTYSPNVFNTWQILRASQNFQFYVLDTVNNAYARSYLDTSLTWQQVDQSFYQYAVQLVQNYEAKAPTNTIKSILLTQTSNSNKGPSTFTWTSYDGWDSVAYELEGGLVESGNIDWENLFGPFAGGVLDYEYTWPTLAEGDSMTYAFRVKGTEPHNPSNPFISESNWIYLTFTEPKNDPDIVETGDIPNVFTPNGDMNNDLFLLDGNSYSNVSISVYNRWGKLVYEDIDAPKEEYKIGGKGWNGTDQNTGNLLADGTYYILLDFNHEPTGQSEQIKGTLNIFTSGTR